MTDQERTERQRRRDDHQAAMLVAVLQHIRYGLETR